MKKPLFIFGAGGLGREFQTLVNALPQWNLEGFFDDNIPPGTLVGGVLVLGGLNELRQLGKQISLILAIGDPSVKAKLARLIAGVSVEFPVLVHPSAVLQDPATIEISPGAVIAAGCILTTSIKIGAHSFLNLRATVGHDTVIGDYSSIMPGVNLAGRVTVGKEVLVGSGANVINNVRLGDRCKIGSGAVVLHDTPPDTTSVGVPAVVIKK